MNCALVHIESRPATRPASWTAIGSLSVGGFALVTSELLPIGLLPEISRGTGVTEGQAGTMVTMTGLLAALAAPLSVVLAGRIDRRRVLIVLLSLLVLSNLVVACAAGLALLLAGRVLLGVTVGGFWTISGTLGPRLRPGPDGVRANALILAGVSMGAVAGVPIGALIGDHFGWRVAFVAAALLASVAVVAPLALLPAVPASAGVRLREIVLASREPRVSIGLVAVVLAFTGQFTAYTYVAPFLAVRSGITGVLLGALLLANGVAGFFGNIVGGWISSCRPRAAVLAMATLLGASILALEAWGASAVAGACLMIVATGDVGSHFQRHHRYPGTHPLAARRFFAFPAAARGARWLSASALRGADLLGDAGEAAQVCALRNPFSSTKCSARSVRRSAMT